MLQENLSINDLTQKEETNLPESECILDLQEALTLDLISSGIVYMNTEASIRQGRNGKDFMVGKFMDVSGEVEFKAWSADIFKPLLSGSGLYVVRVRGSAYNGSQYLTLEKASTYTGGNINASMFYPSLDTHYVNNLYKTVVLRLKENGVSDRCFHLFKQVISQDHFVKERFFFEGAAMRHHDNKIHGLLHHTTKMLNVLVSVLQIYPELKAHADLLAFGILLHDIGKIWEYNNLAEGEYWYANHRIRGIEFLAEHKDSIVAEYNEEFYRQMQCIISGHHGEFADRPKTVATAIIHYIDLLESQITGFIEGLAQQGSGNKVRTMEWGYLQGLPQTSFSKQDSEQTGVTHE